MRIPRRRLGGQSIAALVGGCVVAACTGPDPGLLLGDGDPYADGVVHPVSCGEFLQGTMGFPEDAPDLGACETSGNPACNGRGPETRDCTHCCSALTCTELAERLSAPNAAVKRIGCFPSGISCATGRAVATTDCAACCLSADETEASTTSSGPGFYLPLACGAKTLVTQGNGGGTSHTGKAQYAFDFGLPLDTPLLAMNDGTVQRIKNDVRPGDPCYSGGGSGCANTVNYVVVTHGDSTATLYLHLNGVSVGVGQRVLRGEVVGLSGGTGWSTGPHAHVQRQELCESWWCQSVPMAFADIGGVPKQGDSVASKNACP